MDDPQVSLISAIDGVHDYAVKLQRLHIGDRGLTVRSLLDHQQFSDPHGHAEARGISSANWSHFGQIWPASVVLAEHMSTLPLRGRSVLEVGCGLAVPGLVLHQRGADVVVSDHHPECQPFLLENLRLNGLGPLSFLDVDWSAANPQLGMFDMLIASDVLYERGHPTELVGFFERHALPRAEVLVVDPRRSQAGEFNRRMQASGFARSADPMPSAAGYRIIHYQRGAA